MSKKQKGEIINLRDRVEVIVTEKGEAMPSNSFKEGQVIKVHPKLAEYFIKHGVAISNN